MSDPWSWAIIVLLVFLSFFFSLSETALAACNMYKMQAEAENGNHFAKMVVKVNKNFDSALTAVLIGNNIAAVGISTIATLLFYNILKGTSLEEHVVLISTSIMALVVYILGDALPKTIANLIPDTVSKMVAYPIRVLTFILWPISIIFSGLVKLIQKMFKVKEESSITTEDIELAVDHIEDIGSLDEEQIDIISSALEFTDTTVKQVYTPKSKMVAFDINGLTAKEVANTIASTNFSRFPIYQDDINNIVGTIVAKSFFRSYLKNPNVSIKKIMQKPFIVSTGVSLPELMDGFKKERTHLAVVQSKTHQTIGIITMEDVLEELVEDIAEPKSNKGNK